MAIRVLGFAESVHSRTMEFRAGHEAFFSRSSRIRVAMRSLMTAVK
jgi:hypothetical protein